MPHGVAGCIIIISMVWLGGCEGPQSVLDPARRAAEQIARLFLGMAGGAVVVWLAVAALAVYAVRGAKTAKEERLAKFLIIGGGAIVPTVVLAILACNDARSGCTRAARQP
jgi:cytochrome c oxidase subunit II